MVPIASVTLWHNRHFFFLRNNHIIIWNSVQGKRGDSPVMLLIYTVLGKEQQDYFKTRISRRSL